MHFQPEALLGLPRGELLAQARATLIRQAAEIYAPEAMPVVASLFRRNTEVMEDAQLAFIVLRGGFS